MTQPDPFVELEDRCNRSLMKLGRLVLIGMVVQLIVIGYVAYAQYQGRKDQVENSRAACERNKLDRADNSLIAHANATNWREASGVRRANGDDSVANEYAKNADVQDKAALSLQNRAQVVCAEAFPKASLLR